MLKLILRKKEREEEKEREKESKGVKTKVWSGNLTSLSLSFPLCKIGFLTATLQAEARARGGIAVALRRVSIIL